MTDTQKQLVGRYFELKQIERDAHKECIDILSTLSSLAPHKVGEIITWTEKNTHNERSAVLTAIVPLISYYGDEGLTYKYDFKPINKDDGTVCINLVYPFASDYTWTGAIHPSFLDK